MSQNECQQKLKQINKTQKRNKIYYLKGLIDEGYTEQISNDSILDKNVMNASKKYLIKILVQQQLQQIKLNESITLVKSLNENLTEQNFNDQNLQFQQMFKFCEGVAKQLQIIKLKLLQKQNIQIQLNQIIIRNQTQELTIEEKSIRINNQQKQIFQIKNKMSEKQKQITQLKKKNHLLTCHLNSIADRGQFGKIQRLQSFQDNKYAQSQNIQLNYQNIMNSNSDPTSINSLNNSKQDRESLINQNQNQLQIQAKVKTLLYLDTIKRQSLDSLDMLSPQLFTKKSIDFKRDAQMSQFDVPSSTYKNFIKTQKNSQQSIFNQEQRNTATFKQNLLLKRQSFEQIKLINNTTSLNKKFKGLNGQSTQSNRENNINVNLEIIKQEKNCLVPITHKMGGQQQNIEPQSQISIIDKKLVSSMDNIMSKKQLMNSNLIAMADSLDFESLKKFDEMHRANEAAKRKKPKCIYIRR